LSARESEASADPCTEDGDSRNSKRKTRSTGLNEGITKEKAMRAGRTRGSNGCSQGDEPLKDGILPRRSCLQHAAVASRSFRRPSHRSRDRWSRRSDEVAKIAGVPGQRETTLTHRKTRRSKREQGKCTDTNEEGSQRTTFRIGRNPFLPRSSR
jgi:hypothetical protein